MPNEIPGYTIKEVECCLTCEYSCFTAIDVDDGQGTVHYKECWVDGEPDDIETFAPVISELGWCPEWEKEEK